MVWMWSLRSHSKFILISCCVAIASDVLFYGVLPSTLPYDLEDRIGLLPGRVQIWVAVIPALYCASMVVCSPIAGILSDISARRQPLFLCATIFQLVGTGLLIVSPSLAYYIAGVVIAGCSSAFVWSISLALVQESAPEDCVASSMGYVGLSISCAAFIGPVLGGITYQHGGQSAVWAMFFGVIGVDLVLRLLIIEPRALSSPTTNAENEMCEASEVTDLQHTTNGLPATSNIPTTAHRQSPSDERLGIFELLKSPRLGFSMVATLCLSTAMTSFDGSLPIHVKTLFGFSSTETGLLYLAVAVPAFIQPFVGHWVDKHGGSFIGPAVFLLSCPAFVCLRFVDNDSTSRKVLLIFLLAIIGLLLAAGIPVYMSQVSHVVLNMEKSDSSMSSNKSTSAQAHALWSAIFTTGCTLGPLWGGWVQHAAGWGTETWTIALLCGVIGILALVFTVTDRPRAI